MAEAPQVALTPQELAQRAIECPGEMSLGEMEAYLRAESAGGLLPGELPLRAQMDRERSLDSPAYLMTEVLDPFYLKHFEQIHYNLIDELLGPWLIGETVRVDGANYDPRQYTGLLVLQSRSTLKSTILRMMAQWIALYRKLRLSEDTRTMFVHKVLEKAVEHSEAIRETARRHKKWRESFPEFKAVAAKEWDTKSKWRWPCFGTYQATEWSWTCYGETSSKEGGHYTERLIDDWVTEDSATGPTMLEQSFEKFRKMDNLRDRNRDYNPWIAMGTNYHYQDTYQRLEQQGGWLVWRMPCATGSPKRVFEIASMEDKTETGRKKIRRAVKDLEANPPGELHFPKMLPWDEIVRSSRTTGPLTTNCQLYLNPMPEGEQRFDREALEAGWEDTIPGPSEMFLYLRCDPAISEKRSADETAYVMGGVRWNAERWIIDGWIGREKQPTEIVRTGFDLARKWQAKGYTVKSIGYESVQYQEALAAIARYGIPEREAEYSGESVPILKSPCHVVSIKRPPDMTKLERIVSMDGPISRRELKFWKGCAIGQKVWNQFANFPFDRFDALDAAHDLWIGTITPPRVMEDVLPPLHPELMAILAKSGKLPGDSPQLRGTNNTVSLTAWG